MIYTELTKKAMKIAYDAHHGQLDKGGLPYVFHPWHLAEQMDDEISTIAALLHDVVEDTDWTLEQLEAEGFPPESMEALGLLTHPEGQPYMEYVAGLRHNSVAVKVKLADLRHNSDFTRLSAVTAGQRARLEQKYAPAFALLEGKAGTP
ncbi:MAG: GTP pyrophosphokinase [Clostridiales bacterium]|nr:MAG: GTP pyrophosphokinase [Clostridiales bacterium]